MFFCCWPCLYIFLLVEFSSKVIADSFVEVGVIPGVQVLDKWDAPTTHTCSTRILKYNRCKVPSVIGSFAAGDPPSDFGTGFALH